MKIKRSSVCFTLVFLIPVSMSQAALFDRGGGLIYDDVLDVKWLQDSNYIQTSGASPDGRLNWHDANAWADNLVYYDPVRNISWDD